MTLHLNSAGQLKSFKRQNVLHEDSHYSTSRIHCIIGVA